ncbi:MAG TPA: hypothetical protein VMG80_05705, partial [Solirubrobacteraceae bacterium]|nr:hypothetical protein [Solirubrobacteraceae bacterium]
PLRYRIRELPAVPEVLDFLATHAGLEPKAAYSTFNMGAGYAVYCAPGAGVRAIQAAAGLGLEAFLAGAVEEGPREVVLEPIGVSLAGSELRLSG